MSKLARLPVEDTASGQLDMQNDSSFTDLVGAAGEAGADRHFVKSRLENEIRTTLDKFARELIQASKQRGK